MKEIKKIVSKSLFLLITVFLVTQCLTVSVKAEPIQFPKEILSNTSVLGIIEKVKNMPSNGRITNVSVTNKKIATASSYGMNSMFIEPKSVGKTTLRFTVQYGSKKKTFKTAIKIYKYINPIASCKINGKELKKVFNKKEIYEVKGTNKNINISVKPRAGWKITFAVMDNFTINKQKIFKITPSALSAKFKATENSRLTIDITNKKTGLVDAITIFYQ